jgi:hypothetical protein
MGHEQELEREQRCYLGNSRKGVKWTEAGVSAVARRGLVRRK